MKKTFPAKKIYITMKRLTKEEYNNAKEWDKFLFDIIEECFICWYKEYWWILITKIPEMVNQCIECSEKNKDETSKWRWVYIIWSWFIEEKE